MRVHIGSDHAGFELKNFLVSSLGADGHDVVDHGPTSYDALDDYPSFCIRAARAVVADQREGTTASRARLRKPGSAAGGNGP